jgi:phage/plasmid-associated DNA primase
VTEATNEYRAEMDHVARFLEERCTRTATGRDAADRLYTVYANWAEEGRERPLSRQMFVTCLEEQGFAKRRSCPNGSAEWHGLELQEANGHY